MSGTEPTKDDAANYYAALLTGHDTHKITHELISNFDRILLYLVAAHALSARKDGEKELDDVLSIWESKQKSDLSEQVEKMEAMKNTPMGAMMKSLFTDSEGLRLHGLQKIEDAKACLSVMLNGIKLAMGAIRTAREMNKEGWQ